MEVKEEKVQQLLKQLEIKTNDTQKFRTAAEAAKVNNAISTKGGNLGHRKDNPWSIVTRVIFLKHL